jgi:hypothetical protein
LLSGEFVKTHGLQAGDALIIYKNSVPGKFVCETFLLPRFIYL